MARPHLGQHLAAGGDRLSLERLGGCGSEDLRGDQPAEQVLQRDPIHHREGALDVGGKAQRPAVGAVLHPVVRVADAELHAPHLEARPVERLGTHRAGGGPQRRAVGFLDRQLHARRAAHLLGKGGADAVRPEELGLFLGRRGRVQRGLEEDQRPPVVDDLPHDAVHLSQLLQAGGEAAALPLGALGGDAVLVGVGQLGDLDPEGPIGRLPRPPARAEQRSGRCLETLLRRPGEEDPHRAEGEKDHLALPLHDPHRHGGLAGPHVEAAGGGGRGDVERCHHHRGRAARVRGILGACGRYHRRRGRWRRGRRGRSGPRCGAGGDEQRQRDGGAAELGRGDRQERRHPDSNRGMRVLQTLALPLGDGAGRQGFVGHAARTGQETHVCATPR